MEVIIHRGMRQIGGCVTEVRTAETRLIIDFGSDLPAEDGTFPEEPLLLEGVNWGAPGCDAVLFSHYHADHVGRIQEILPGVPCYMGSITKEVLRILKRWLKSDDLPYIEQASTFTPLQPFFVGDIKITPIPADHSAYDAYMFLLEAAGQKILHTGDFRLHGFRGPSTESIITRYVGSVDLLITEGTLLGRSAAPLSEFAVQEQMKELLCQYRYVFVLCSSTNIDRLAMVCNNTPRGRYFVCDSYQREIFALIRERSKSRYYGFHKALVYGENLALDRGFVMPVRKGPFFKAVMEKYVERPEALLIYSMWDGYLAGRDLELLDFVKPFMDLGKMEFVHSSGHASLEDIKRLVEWTRPRQVLPIHTEAPEALEGVGAELISLPDGGVLSL